jgi:hypothetical protein
MASSLFYFAFDFEKFYFYFNVIAYKFDTDKSLVANNFSLKNH